MQHKPGYQYGHEIYLPKPLMSLKVISKVFLLVEACAVCVADVFWGYQQSPMKHLFFIRTSLADYSQTHIGVIEELTLVYITYTSLFQWTCDWSDCKVKIRLRLLCWFNWTNGNRSRVHFDSLTVHLVYWNHKYDAKPTQVMFLAWWSSTQYGLRCCH